MDPMNLEICSDQSERERDLCVNVDLDVLCLILVYKEMKKN